MEKEKGKQIQHCQGTLEEYIRTKEWNEYKTELQNEKTRPIFLALMTVYK